MKVLLSIAAVMVTLVLLANAFEEVSIKEKHRKVFQCQACQTFAREYSDRINDKESDEHPEILNGYAKGNASLYLWDEHTEKLWPQETRRGGQAIDEIDNYLTHVILDHHATEVVMHAVHAAAHRRNPARVPWTFVWQVLCVEKHGVCEENLEKVHHGSHEVLRHDYENYRGHFEEPHMDTYEQNPYANHEAYQYHSEHETEMAEHPYRRPMDDHGEPPFDPEDPAHTHYDEDPGIHHTERRRYMMEQGGYVDDAGVLTPAEEDTQENELGEE